LRARRAAEAIGVVNSWDMCGRYTLTKNEDLAEELEAKLEASVASDPWWKPRFNVAPTQPAPVVVQRGIERSIELMRWGLVPHWGTQPGSRPPLMINARIESLGAKQVFREALAHKRCLVPADGFFEWVRADGKVRGKKPAPQPFYFHPLDRHRIAFAGLWAQAVDEHGHALHSFTIVTAKANELVQPIHDRMPVVLDPRTYDAWLDPLVDSEAAAELMVDAHPQDWMREAVSTWVNKADHDDPQCIAPDAATVAAVQGDLFG
jgi:putative SOS response-associated peptidase YedK